MKNNAFQIKTCLLCAAFFLVIHAASAQEKSVITVERAQATETRKNEITDSDIIFFRGDVVLSVVKGATTTKITAELVQYDRKRQMLYAEGSVKLEQKSGDKGTEQIEANALLFDVRSLEGTFDNGKVLQNQSGDSKTGSSGTVMMVNAEIFGRNKSGTIGFKDGLITFCDDPEPHWKIKASRIWLLPGNEFAFLNGVMYVGNIPVFYLPFFYYPKDELVFNPVFGFRQREGFYMQTTIYLLGRKSPAETTGETGMFNFTQSDQQMEQKLDGLFLRNTDKKLAQVPENSLKIMADVYTGLGFMAGVGGSFKPKKVVTALDFTFNLGFSKTLFPVSGSNMYIPVNPNTGETHWDKSELFGFTVPFRYSANVKLNLSAGFFQMSLSMPLYSDPYFDSDFFDRSESMDWISYLINNTGKAPEEINANDLLSSFSWQLNGSLSPTLDILKPYIKNIKITSFESGIQFSSKANAEFVSGSILSVVSPLRTFYYPQVLTPLKLSLSIDGTLFSTEKYITQKKSIEGLPQLTPPPDLVQEETDKKTPQTSETAAADKKAVADKKTVADKKAGEDKTNPDDENETAAENSGENQTADGEKIAENNGVEESSKNAAAGELQTPDGFLPLELFPELKLASPQVTTLSRAAYSLNYKLMPTFSSQNVYPSETFLKPSDINWSKFNSTFISIGGNVELNSNLGIRNNFVSMSNSVIFEPLYQRHPYISDAYYSTAQKDQIILGDYTAQKFNIANVNTVTFKPFVLNKYFSDTSVYWSLSTKLLRTEFTGTAQEPDWNYILPSWNTSSITAHTMNLNLAAKQADGAFRQTLLLTANLPPLAESYTGRITLVFPYVEISADSGIKKQTPTSQNWTFVPINQSATVSLFDKKLVLRQNFRYELEKNYAETFNVSLSFAGIETSYNMLYASVYDLDQKQGWINTNEKKFMPYSLSFKYTQPSKTFYSWKGRVYFAPSLNTSLVFRFDRQTESYFTFTPAITFKINEFFNITFSSESRNNVIFRYFQDIANFPLTIPGEKNLFIDLFNSFAFWDEEKRRSSGFKLSSLSMKAEHSLHDWTLSVELTIQPRLLYNSSAKPYYDMSPYFKLSVVWKPLSAMKTTIVDDYGSFKLNP